MPFARHRDVVSCSVRVYHMLLTRRTFFGSTAGLAFSGLLSLAKARDADPKKDPGYLNQIEGYGPLQADPNGLLMLPKGFSYKIISTAGEIMNDGLLVPGLHDGMACFTHPTDSDKVILVRNHEIKHTRLKYSAFGSNGERLTESMRDKVYDFTASGLPLPGGTTTLVYDLKSKSLISHHLSLAGTSTNCAGGPTPWGSWLTCEETNQRAGSEVGKDHGYVFEVASTETGLVKPVPLKEMGRFAHEACAVDPKTGTVYMTEDKEDCVFYRYIPNIKGQLNQGGKLQALVISDHPKAITSNHPTVFWAMGQSYKAHWVDLDTPESPDDDLRHRAFELGAAQFSRGEGITMGAGEMYFTCTSGGAKEYSQVVRYIPDPENDDLGTINLFFESDDERVFDWGDNLVMSPYGNLFVCEDRYSDTLINHLRIITPEGKVATFAAHTGADNSEFAGVCFSPDGSTLFVNVQTSGKTIAITGPWSDFKA